MLYNLRGGFALLLLLLPLGLQAQPEAAGDCGTSFSVDPAFERAAYEAFRASWSRQALNREAVRLPLVARIVRHTDGSGGLNPDLLTALIDTLNQRFLPANIQFYACGDPQFVDVNVFYDFDRSLYADSLVSYNIPNVINIYFINKILNDASFLCGYASFPWNEQEYVVVKNECALNGSTLAHEIGHYLGLYHTHETFYGNEFVDGSNCTYAGDELCDTPADPRLGTHNVNTACEYTGRSRDLNGQFYEPDPGNIMSYSRKACRTHFSAEQGVRMQYYLQRNRSHLACEQVTADEALSHLPRLQLYPNPASGLLHLRLEAGTYPHARYVVWNARGSVVLEGPLPMGKPLRLDTGQLPAGLYSLGVLAEGQVFTQKFIKQ